MKKVYFDEAGCNRRRLDLARIRSYLAVNGYEAVERPAEADLVVAVTCAFKKKEEDESIARLRALRRTGRPMFVYGCLQDIAPERYQEFAGVPELAPRKLDEIDRFFSDLEVPFRDVDEAHQPAPATGGLVSLVRRKVQTGALLANTSLGELAESGVRALKALVVKRHEPWSLFVCRGCRGRCTYCAIRRSIGGVKSKPIPTVLEEFREGVRQGFRDFAILGDDPGCYGVDIGESLPRLLKDLASACEEPEVKAAIDNAAVFRLKEVHPKFVVAYDGALTDPRWFGRMKSMLCPVQSGNARVLEMMEREHAPDDLLRVLRRAKRANPQVSLDTQVIVGFPSETEEEFGDTLRMVRDAGFSSVVVFPYHDKEGAAAAELEPKVPQPVVKRRMADAFRFFKKEGIQATYSCP